MKPLIVCQRHKRFKKRNIEALVKLNSKSHFHQNYIRHIIMNPEFHEWLSKKFAPTTVKARMSNAKKIEEHYGNLDDYIKNESFNTEVLKTLEYTTQDARANKPNPSKLKFEGVIDIKNNLAMYKNTAKLYLSFFKEIGSSIGSRIDSSEPVDEVDSGVEIYKQKLSLERDMEVALRRNIENLDTSLRIIDGGIQRSVDSGFIDITCEDNVGLVVVELKAGMADSRAIGQILGYMGDLQEEHNERKVRGILVAHDFDKRAAAAARVVPTLSVIKYSIEFRFDH